MQGRVVGGEGELVHGGGSGRGSSGDSQRGPCAYFP